jgi:hypothetical protein
MFFRIMRAVYLHDRTEAGNCRCDAEIVTEVAAESKRLF